MSWPDALLGALAALAAIGAAFVLAALLNVIRRNHGGFRLSALDEPEPPSKRRERER